MVDAHPPRAELRLSEALQRILLAPRAAGAPLSLGHIIESTGERSFGVLMAFLCLPFLIPLPLPGVSIPFGMALMILGIQLAVRKHHPWLPRRLLGWQLPERSTTRFIGLVVRIFRPLERFIRPRLLFMQHPAAMVLVGTALVVDGFILSLPLPPIIPLSNSIPAYMALVKILGITEEDGVALLLGVFLSLAAVATAVGVLLASWHHIVA